MVGRTRVGKSFILNLLMLCTAVDDETYKLQQPAAELRFCQLSTVQNLLGEGSREATTLAELRQALLGSVKLHVLPAEYAALVDPAREADSMLDAIKDFGTNGRLGSNLRAALLTSKGSGSAVSNLALSLHHALLIHVEVERFTRQEFQANCRNVLAVINEQEGLSKKEKIQLLRHGWKPADPALAAFDHRMRVLIDLESSPAAAKVWQCYRDGHELPLCAGADQILSSQHELFLGTGASRVVDQCFARDVLEAFNGSPSDAVIDRLNNAGIFTSALDQSVITPRLVLHTSMQLNDALHAQAVAKGYNWLELLRYTDCWRLEGVLFAPAMVTTARGAQALDPRLQEGIKQIREYNQGMSPEAERDLAEVRAAAKEQAMWRKSPADKERVIREMTAPGGIFQQFRSAPRDVEKGIPSAITKFLDLDAFQAAVDDSKTTVMSRLDGWFYSPTSPLIMQAYFAIMKEVHHGRPKAAKALSKHLQSLEEARGAVEKLLEALPPCNEQPDAEEKAISMPQLDKAMEMTELAVKRSSVLRKLSSLRAQERDAQRRRVAAPTKAADAEELTGPGFHQLLQRSVGQAVERDLAELDKQLHKQGLRRLATPDTNDGLFLALSCLVFGEELDVGDAQAAQSVLLLRHAVADVLRDDGRAGLDAMFRAQHDMPVATYIQGLRQF
ncbi:hypothetical protein WJX72_004077 [[Myrmecia] bisecta]|uniref:Uncharacterized protein n=1 Tax=[Myrmecia] bisecta TaxID=41462 RepID=A0AAW1PX03_9CHLO